MPKPILKKVPISEQHPEERIKNFNEVPYGYVPGEAMKEAKRCLQCKNAPCITGCPVEIDIPGFIKAIGDGDFGKSIKILKEKTVLPAVCGRVCPQEEQCEKVCTLAKIGEPVAIGRLERFSSEWEAIQKTTDIPKIPAPTGKRVAVVGSGPAGLTIAGDLAMLGHNVVIFEALHQPGGVLIYGIPEFRLPKVIVEREIEYIKKLGVQIITSFVVGKTKTIDELLKEFDAIFVAAGAGLPWFMNIPGENYNGIYSANEYLTRANLMKAYLFPEWDTPIIKGKRVAVIGGGNVAMDSARTALRLGAESSMIIYRRSENEMPARMEEIIHAKEEGIDFHFLTLPVQYYADDLGWVNNMECIKMELGEPDSSGRRQPISINDSNFKIPVDVVIVAIGNSPNPLITTTTPGIEITKKGTIQINEKTGETSKSRVYAGGDVATGAATVILAMGTARIAAKSIHSLLQNK
ncbi:MAG: NADPH-dependent glutamate synthase [bacterium]|nr:NADPH-dependent glutamate synthase [bacterium]